MSADTELALRFGRGQCADSSYLNLISINSKIHPQLSQLRTGRYGKEFVQQKFDQETVLERISNEKIITQLFISNSMTHENLMVL